MLYDIVILFTKEIFLERRIKAMNSADVIWKLIELLLKEKEQKSVSEDEKKD